MADHDEPKGFSAEHVRIFRHVGVSNLEDWEAVAREMIKRHAPHLLTGEKSVKRRRGRPAKWDGLSGFYAVQAVRHVRSAWKRGEIRQNLKTLGASCAYLTEDNAKARDLREQFQIPHGTTMENLRNKVSEQGGWRDP